MMDSKTIGIVQFFGAVIAGYFGWQSSDWGVLVLALVFLIMSAHHFTEENKKRRR